MESFNTADYLNEDVAVSEQFNFGISGDDTAQVQITEEVFNLINTVARDAEELTVAHDVDEFLFSAECANTERYNPQTSLHTPFHDYPHASNGAFDSHNNDNVSTTFDDGISVVFSSVQNEFHPSANETTENILVKNDISTPPPALNVLSLQHTTDRSQSHEQMSDSIASSYDQPMINASSHQHTPDRSQLHEQNSGSIATSYVQPSANNIVSQKAVSQNLDCNQSNHKKRKIERPGKPCTKIMKSKQAVLTSNDLDMPVSASTTSGTKNISASRTKRKYTKKSSKISMKPENIPPTPEYISKLKATTVKISDTDPITNKTSSICKVMLTDDDASIVFVLCKLDIIFSETNIDNAWAFNRDNKSTITHTLKSIMSTFVTTFLSFANSGSACYYCSEYKTTFTISLNVCNTTMLKSVIIDQIVNRILNTTFAEEITICFNTNMKC